MKTILPLIFILLLSFSVFSQDTKPENTKTQNDKYSKQNKKDSPLKIISKPRPSYTERARTNNTQGKVLLMVEFKADGEIGEITIVQALPFGLTENSIKSARKIKFEPEIENGKSITVKKQVPYSFTIY